MYYVSKLFLVTSRFDHANFSLAACLIHPQFSIHSIAVDQVLVLSDSRHTRTSSGVVTACTEGMRDRCVTNAHSADVHEYFSCLSVILLHLLLWPVHCAGKQGLCCVTIRVNVKRILSGWHVQQSLRYIQSQLSWLIIDAPINPSCSFSGMCSVSFASWNA